MDIARKAPDRSEFEIKMDNLLSAATEVTDAAASLLAEAQEFGDAKIIERAERAFDRVNLLLMEVTDYCEDYKPGWAI